MPLFSICIPNFNYERYIGQTIESVLAQDEQDFEIIVADNASTDASVRVVESLMMRSDKIRLVRNRFNVGFAGNLDKAARPATGRFMIMLSSDDLMRPGALRAYRRAYEAMGPEADRSVVFSSVEVIDGEGRVFDRKAPPPFYDFRSHSAELDELKGSVIDGTVVLRHALTLHSNPMPFCATAYPRALYEAVEGYNGTWAYSPDFHFLLKLLSQEPRVVYLDHNHFGYRVHAANQLARQTAKNGPLKFEIDRYQQCLDYDPRTVSRAGVDHAEMVRVLIDDICLRRGAAYVADGEWIRAFRLLCLSLALYPQVAVKRPRTYGLMAMLMLGPAGRLVAKGVRVVARRVAPTRHI